MSAAPDVLWLHGDQLYDDTATAWDARNLQPLVVPEAEAPLTHRGDCWAAGWEELASLAYLCSCTAGQQYTRRQRAEVAL